LHWLGKHRRAPSVFRRARVKPRPAGPENQLCIALLQLLGPSRHLDFRLTIPADAKRGRYRVCTDAIDEGPFRGQGGSHELCTDPFEVAAR
jgi:hypothetical protein